MQQKTALATGLHSPEKGAIISIPEWNEANKWKYE